MHCLNTWGVKMIVAISKLSYDWVQKHKEYNCGQCYIGLTKAELREAMAKDKVNYDDYVFFTDKTRAK